VTLRVRASEELQGGNDSDPTDTQILFPMRTDNAYEATFTFPIDADGCPHGGSAGAALTMGLQEYWEFRFLEVTVLASATLPVPLRRSIARRPSGLADSGSPPPFQVEFWTLQYPWVSTPGPLPPAPSAAWVGTAGAAQLSRSANADSDAQAGDDVAIAEFEGWFRSPHSEMQQIYDICKYTLSASSVDTVTDSNTRERRPYEGDMLVNLAHRSSMQRESAFGRHSAEQVLLHHTWPTEYLQIMSIVAAQELQSAGTATVGRKFTEQLFWFSMLRDYVDEHSGLVNFTGKARVPGTRDIIDWPQDDRDGYVFSDTSLVINAHASAAGDALCSLARAMGNESFAERACGLAEGVRRGMAGYMWDSESKTFCDTVCSANNHSAVHSKMIPLAFGALAQGEAPSSPDGVAGLASGIRSEGMGNLSVYGAYFFVNGLGAAGGTSGGAQGQTALASAFDASAEGEHSWLHMLQVGATMTREAWTTGEKPNLSWSHPWATAPVSLAVRVILGIQSTGPGYSSVLVAPQPAGLPWAEGAVPTVRGPVAVGFNCSGDGCFGGTGGSVEVRASVPPSTAATVCVPWLGTSSCNVTVAAAGSDGSG